MADFDKPLAVDAGNRSQTPESQESGGTNWKRVVIIVAILIAAIASCSILTSKFCGPSDEEKAEERRKGFHCLDVRDGSHLDLKREVLENIADPDSFEHIETRIGPVDADGEHYLTMKFRARNSFGGMVVAEAEGIVYNEDCEHVLLSINLSR